MRYNTIIKSLLLKINYHALRYDVLIIQYVLAQYSMCLLSTETKMVTVSEQDGSDLVEPK